MNHFLYCWPRNFEHRPSIVCPRQTIRAVALGYDIAYSISYLQICKLYRFEDDAGFHYLKIPIKDHWSQSLTSYLPSAISFIGMQYALVFHIRPIIIPAASITVGLHNTVITLSSIFAHTPCHLSVWPEIQYWVFSGINGSGQSHKPSIIDARITPCFFVPWSFPSFSCHSFSPSSAFLPWFLIFFPSFSVLFPLCSTPVTRTLSFGLKKSTDKLCNWQSKSVQLCVRLTIFWSIMPYSVNRAMSQLLSVTWKKHLSPISGHDSYVVS